MQRPILPISNPSLKSLPSIVTSEAAGTVPLRSENELASTCLLISQQSEDEKVDQVKPLLSTSADSTSTNGTAAAAPKFYQKRRRRTASSSSLSDDFEARSSEDRIGHALSETYLMRLKLCRYIGLGYKFITRLVAITFYSFLIFPGFIRVAYYYYSSRQVRRDIVYGNQPRNKLDLYLPKNPDGPKPVVAFITGGAWIIGYKAWGSLLGQQLCERDIIVACIDYRNFPKVTIGDMVNDASQGISFVFNHIAEYGGDPNRIYLMGQSAGAHIAACALVEQAIKEANGDNTSWSVSRIKAYFGLSGGYNLFNLLDHFHTRGLYRSVFLRMMEGEKSLRRFSPEVLLQDPANRNAASLLPPTVLFHGTEDYSIPCDSSKSFAETLQSLGVKAEAVMYEGKTHTDVFVQDPMRGGDNEMVRDLVAFIHNGDEEALVKDSTMPPRKRLVPEFMLNLARTISPF
ncbi:isoprenylcysteine alpha-carbonyl methylesterase ICME-like [Impatiens glandulifera]|uniref:isoprenylcysteine alpha-carbonyl methylesterase ICME-like n=1 Tax=Impatiens glandulifera TaxID=253017 RepID=UPI001FB0C196|nr:isoprenylcysteine alpha-carbonyl methylesterase ICME-like [Impatiens glandulifera]